MNNNSGHYPIASLYVGDLAPDVTEAVLFEKFSTAGPVLSIRVCRDIITRRSLGYAYVNYQNSNDADRAIDTLNFERLGGRPIRIMWSQRDPSLRRSGVGNIFIKNLDKTVDNKVMFDTFSVFGNILSCKVSYDDKGNSKGYGFVHFDSEEAAQDAIVNLNGKIILGKKVYVGKFVSRKERETKLGGHRRFTNVYVKNLTEEYDTDDKLYKLFEPYGNITSAVVVKDDESKSKGFGFVCYSSPDGAEAAVSALNSKEMSNGKQLYVGRAQKKAEREAELKRKLELMKLDRINRSQGVNLYVKNLEDVIDDQRLQKEFSAYGTITSAKVMTDDKGRSKGFGFVCFSTPEEATKAVTEMNNRIIATKPLYVALAQRKEDREAQKFAQNLRGYPATSVRLPQMPPQAGAHPHPLGTAQIAFPPNPAAALAGIQAGMQGQPVHGNQPGGPHPYFLPIAPNTQMQRGFYPGTAPAGQVTGQPGPQGIRPNPRWTGNVGGQMGRQQVGGGQYGQGGYRGANPRGIAGPGQQGPVAGRQNLPGGVPPGSNGPTAGGRGPPNAFAQGQGVPTGPSGVPGGPRGSGGPGGRGPAGVQRSGPAFQNKPVTLPGPGPMGMPPQAQQPFPLVPGGDAVSPEEQTQMLGERLYPLVQQHNLEMAGKITGMLLEMDIQDVIHMIDSPESLKAKVDEALAVLQAHRTQEPLGAGKE